MSSFGTDGQPMVRKGGQRLGDIIGKLRRAARKRNEVPKDEIHIAVDQLSQYASVKGLSSETLDALIDILTTPSKLDQSTAAAITKVLFPRNKVAEAVVVKIVGCFGAGMSKPALSTQALLLRWLVMVYNVLEGYTVLSQLYSIIFSMLNMITLRAHTCHLLSLITRRRHVKPFRIQALLELKRVVGNEPPLVGLLQIYKDYYPDVIVERLAPTRAGLFSHPNPEWMETLFAIQEANVLEDLDKAGQLSFQIVRKHGRQGNKRRKTGHLTLPDVCTYGSVEASVTLEEIGNVDDFVSKIEKLELPNQLAAVIEDPLLQKLLRLKISSTEQQRIDNWLAAYLSSELQSNPKHGITTRTKEYLKKLLRYTRYTKKLLSSVQDFLEICLRTYSDIVQLSYVLELLTYLPLGNFQDLHAKFFSHLDHIYTSGSLPQREKLIDFYTGLCDHWALGIHGIPEDSALLQEAADCMIHLMRHLNTICVNALQATCQSAAVCGAALRFYEVAVENPTFCLVLPPDSLVYLSLFAGDVLSLSRLCGILAKYRQTIEGMRKLAESTRRRAMVEYPSAVRNHLNGLILDVCNCVWLNRALFDEAGALGCNTSKKVIEQLGSIASTHGEDLRLLFSLTRSLALARLSKQVFTHLEESAGIEVFNRHHGPPTQDSLTNLAALGGLNINWQDFKREILSECDRRGLTGISELMYIVIPNLTPQRR